MKEETVGYIRGKIRARSTLEKSLWIPLKKCRSEANQRNISHPQLHILSKGGGRSFLIGCVSRGASRSFGLLI